MVRGRGNDVRKKSVYRPKKKAKAHTWSTSSSSSSSSGSSSGSSSSNVIHQSQDDEPRPVIQLPCMLTGWLRYTEASTPRNGREQEPSKPPVSSEIFLSGLGCGTSRLNHGQLAVLDLLANFFRASGKFFCGFCRERVLGVVGPTVFHVVFNTTYLRLA